MVVQVTCRLVQIFRNPDGKTYGGTVEIVKKGDAYHLKWTLKAGDTYAGIGILEGDVLGVSY
jgi:hypothetical protein